MTKESIDAIREILMNSETFCRDSNLTGCTKDDKRSYLDCFTEDDLLSFYIDVLEKGKTGKIDILLLTAKTEEEFIDGVMAEINEPGPSQFSTRLLETRKGYQLMVNEFVIFRYFVEKLQTLKYIYPSYLQAAYGTMMNVKFDGEAVEFSDETIKLFRRAVELVFIPTDMNNSDWGNHEWFMSLPPLPKDWPKPTNNNILFNCLLEKLLER